LVADPFIPENALGAILQQDFSPARVEATVERRRLVERYETLMDASPHMERIRLMQQDREMREQYAQQAQEADSWAQGLLNWRLDLAESMGFQSQEEERPTTVPGVLGMELTPSEAMDRHSRERDTAFQTLTSSLDSMIETLGTEQALAVMSQRIEANPELASFLNEDDRYHELIRDRSARQVEPRQGLGDIARGEAATEAEALRSALATEQDPERRAAIETQLAEVTGYANDPGFSNTDVPNAIEGLEDYVEQSRRYSGEQARYRYNRFVASAMAVFRGGADMAVGAVETTDLLASGALQYLIGYRNDELPWDHPDNRLLDGMTARLNAGLNVLAPNDEARQEEFVLQLSQGVGSLAAFYLVAAMGGGAKTVGTFGALAEGSGQWEQAYALNAAAGQRYIQLLVGMGLGATEAIPIDRTLNRMAQSVGRDRFTYFLAHTAASTMEEMIQEFGQSFGSEYALFVGTGDEIDWEGIGRATAIGGITGGAAGAVTTGVSVANNWWAWTPPEISAEDLQRANAVFDQNAQRTAPQSFVIPPEIVQTTELLDLWNSQDARPQGDTPIAPGEVEPGALPLIENAPLRVAQGIAQQIQQPPQPAPEQEGAVETTPEEEAPKITVGLLGELDPMIAQPIIDAANRASEEIARGEPFQPIVYDQATIRTNLNQNLADREGTRRGWAPQPRVVLAPPAGSNLPPVAVGDITADDWVTKIETMLDQDEISRYAGWYNDTLDIFREIYPGNEGMARNAMVAWLAGQVQQSPDGAALDVLRQNQNEVEGRQGADRLKNSTEATAANVLKALKGEPLTSGVGAKIADFIDSGLGKTTRTWVGDDPRGGSPFVVDRHTARDMGIVDGPYFKALERRGYTFPEGFKRDFDADVPAKGRLYENRANFGRDLTDELNSREWQGRSDWTPAEVQAVGWMATLKLMGESLPTPTSAIDANTFTTAFEIAPGDMSPAAQLFGQRLANLDVAARTRVMEAQGQAAVEAAKQVTSVMATTPITRGVGSWEGTINPSATTGAFASRQQAQAFNAALGFLTDQTAIISARTFPVKKSHTQFAISVMLPPTTTRSAHQGIFDILQSRAPKGPDRNSLFQGFAPVTKNGRDGFVLYVDAKGAKYATALKKFMGVNADLSEIDGPSEFSKAMNRAGFWDDSAVDIVLGGADIVYTENDWEQGYQGYEDAYREATGRPFPAELHRARAEIKSRTAAQIAAEEARQSRGRQRRMAALASQSGSTPFEGPDGRVKLTHWSPSQHTVLDPKKAGTGPLIGQERAAGWKHVFFGLGADQPGAGGYQRENTGDVRHEVTIDGGQLYNLDEDPLGLRTFFPTDKYTGMQRAERVIEMARDLGFRGYINPNHPRGPIAGLYEAVTPDTIVNDRTGETIAERDMDTGDFDAMMISAPKATPDRLSRNYGKLPDRLQPYEIDDRQQALPLAGYTGTTPFQQAMRGTWVTDEDGNPLVVHHGTWKPGFTEFRSDDGVAGWFSDELSTSETYGKSAGNEGLPDFGADLRKIVENGQEFRAGYFRYRFRPMGFMDFQRQQEEADTKKLEDGRQAYLGAFRAFRPRLAEFFGEGQSADAANSQLDRVINAISNSDPNWFDLASSFRVSFDQNMEMYDLPNLNELELLANKPDPQLPARVDEAVADLMTAADAFFAANEKWDTSLTREYDRLKDIREALRRKEEYWHSYFYGIDTTTAVFHVGMGTPAVRAAAEKLQLVASEVEDFRRFSDDGPWKWSSAPRGEGTGYVQEVRSYAGPTFTQEQIETARQQTITALEAIDQSALEQGVAKRVQTSIELARDGSDIRWARRAIWSLENAAKEPLMEQIRATLKAASEPGAVVGELNVGLGELNGAVTQIDDLANRLTEMSRFMQAPDWHQMGPPVPLSEAIRSVRSAVEPQGANTYDAYLRITNPYVVDYQGAQWNRGPDAVSGGNLFVPVMFSAEDTQAVIAQYLPEVAELGQHSGKGGTNGTLVYREIPAELLNDPDFTQRVEAVKQIVEGQVDDARDTFANDVVREMYRVERLVVDGLDAWVEAQIQDVMELVQSVADEQGQPLPEGTEERARERFQKIADNVRAGASAVPLSTLAQAIRNGLTPSAVAMETGRMLDKLSEHGLAYLQHAVRAMMTEMGVDAEHLGTGSLSTSEKSMNELFSLIRANIPKAPFLVNTAVTLETQSFGRNTRAHVQLAKARGHDGVIFRNIFDTAQGETVEPANVFVAFEPTQIKAAGANAGTYSLEDPDILAMAAQPPQAPTGQGTSSERAPYIGEPTRPASGVPVNVLAQNKSVPGENLQKIAQAFRRAMRLTLGQGRMTLRGAGVQAQYDRKQGTIRMNNLRDVSSLFHEGGHALHDAMDGSLRDLVNRNRSELLWMAQNVYPGDVTKFTRDKKVREGFAESFRLFVQNRAELTKLAPGIARELEQMLSVEDPQLLEQLNAIGQMYQSWSSQSSLDALKGMIANVEAPSILRDTREMVAEAGFKEAGRSMMRASVNHFLSNWVNELTGLNVLTARLLNAAEANLGQVPNLLASQDPAKLATMANNFGGRALGFLTDGVRRYRSEDVVSRPLSEALDISQGREPGKNGRTDPDVERDFAAYLAARRALDEIQRGVIERAPVHLQQGELVQAIKDLEAKYGDRFREAAQIVHDYSMALWDRMHDAGLLTDEQYQEQVNRGFYVPLMRDMTDKGGDIGAMLGNLTNAQGGMRAVVHQFKGSDRNIIDPMQALIQKTISIEQMISQNEVRQALHRLAQQGGRFAGSLVERVPAYEPKVTGSASAAEIVKRLTKDNSVSASEALEMQIALQPYVDANSELNFFRMDQTSPNGDPIVYLRERGKVIALEIKDQEIAADVVNYFNMFGGHRGGEFLNSFLNTLPGKMLSEGARVFRAGVTSWPDFILVNFVRDQVQAAVSTSEGYVPFASGMKGVAKELAQKDMARLYNYYQGIMGGAGTAQYDEARVAADLEVLRGRGYTTRVFRHSGPGMLRGLTQLTEVSETGTRLGLFEAAYRRAKAEGLSDYDAGVEASYVATDYMNYGLHGSKTMILRRLVPFFNANIVGLTKMWRVLGNTEVGRRKGALYAMTSLVGMQDTSTLTDAERKAVRTARGAWLKMGILGLISAMLTKLFEDDEAYQQTSPYLRQTGWVIPNGDEIIYIPKPFEWAMVANFIERALEYQGGDEEALRTFAQSTRESLVLPTDNPLFATFQQIRNNYDPFSERELIPFWMQAEVAADASLGVNAYTSQLARDIGGFLDVPPIYVDHALQNMGASMARDVSTMYNQIFSDVDQSLSRNDAPILRRFFRDSSRGSAVMDDFWETYSGADGGLQGAAAAYDAYIAQRGEEGAIARAEEIFDEPERIYAYLNEHFSAAEKRLHPMRWAGDYNQVLRGMRNDIRSPLGLADTSDDMGRIIDLTPTQRTDLQALLSDLSTRVARNALIDMGHPTWDTRQRGDVNGTIAMIREISPAVADELENRLLAGRVYSEDAIRELWPEAMERLQIDGPAAYLDDLSSMARSW
jgi:hypothetical protein